ncbi:unnamed protein product [Miscanthus lutarioriparius]|uniref:Uncharacterized protein n=1 Tax=Miscanthus lutarioriparius TaxID=422564 RepID=A0A811NXH7_9POAL|nr:unnamed protein product [Miscanthus lutarioriparius]
MESDGSGEGSPNLPPLATAAEAVLAQAAGSSLSPFAAPWAPSSPAAAGPSAWGPQDMLSFSDSDAYSDESDEPEPVDAADKGKAVMAPSRGRRRRRRSRPCTGGFMADARRQPPPRAAREASPQRLEMQAPRASLRVSLRGLLVLTTTSPGPAHTSTLMDSRWSRAAVAGAAGSARMSPATAPSRRRWWASASTAWRGTTSPPSAVSRHAAYTAGARVTALATASVAASPRDSPRAAGARRGHVWCAQLAHRRPPINAVKEALSSLALVAIVGGTRPPVSPAEVRELLVSFYHIPSESFTVSRYSQKDFLVRFNDSDNLLTVLHGPVPVNTPFFVVWKRWHRQSMASAGALRYKVLLGLRGMPAHIAGLDAAERILASSCADLVEAPQMADREDLREFFVAAWCIHPRFIPQQKIIVVPLYLREHEVIRSELPALRYLVRIRVVESQDWTTPPSTDNDESPGDSDDGEDPDWLDWGNRGRSGPWPRRHRFCGGGDDENSGGAPDPQLGPGWGPTFREAPRVVVRKIPSPLRPEAGLRSARSHLLTRPKRQMLTAGPASPSSTQSPKAANPFEFQTISTPMIAPSRIDPMLTFVETRDDGRAPPRVAPIDALLSSQEPDMAPLSCQPGESWAAVLVADGHDQLARPAVPPVDRGGNPELLPTSDDNLDPPSATVVPCPPDANEKEMCSASVEDFIAGLRLPLEPLLIQSPPRLRLARSSGEPRPAS